MLHAEHQFRRIIGYSDLAKLVIAIERHNLAVDTPPPPNDPRTPSPPPRSLPSDHQNPGAIAVKVPRRPGQPPTGALAAGSGRPARTVAISVSGSGTSWWPESGRCHRVPTHGRRSDSGQTADDCMSSANGRSQNAALASGRSVAPMRMQSESRSPSSGSGTARGAASCGSSSGRSTSPAAATSQRWPSLLDRSST